MPVLRPKIPILEIIKNNFYNRFGMPGGPILYITNTLALDFTPMSPWQCSVRDICINNIKNIFSRLLWFANLSRVLFWYFDK